MAAGLELRDVSQDKDVKYPLGAFFVRSQTVHTPDIITDSGCYYHSVVLSVQDHYDVGVQTRKSCSALREKRTRWYASQACADKSANGVDQSVVKPTTPTTRRSVPLNRR